MQLPGENAAAGEVTAYLTAKFKLHNPSKRRRAMIDHALVSAHLAFDKLLRKVRPDVEALEQITDPAEAKRAHGELGFRLQRMATKIRALGNAAKASVTQDVSEQIDSYLALCKSNPATSYPKAARLRARPGEEAAKALERLAGAVTIAEENAARDALALARRAGTPRPLNILNNRIKDGALILKDEKGRLAAFINLFPKSSRFATCISLKGFTDTRTSRKMTGKTSTGALFPLECGDWHIENFLSGPKIQSSRLIREGDAYYFAATFRFSRTALPEPVNFLGVDRGIEQLAAWAVVNPEGKAIEAGACSGEALRRVQRREHASQRETQKTGRTYRARVRRAVADIETHRAATAIVEAAIRSNARVVLEDLATISNEPHMRRAKGERRGGFRHMLTRAQYQKLKHALDYKLRFAGVASMRRNSPPFLEVTPAYTSIVCATCGALDKALRRSQAEFVCTKCGASANADENAAANVASKGLHLSTIVKSKKKGEKLKDGERWQEWRRSHAGAGRESVFVRASAVCDGAPMTGPGPAYARADRKPLARKSDGAGSPEDALQAKSSASNRDFAIDVKALRDSGSRRTRKWELTRTRIDRVSTCILASGNGLPMFMHARPPVRFA
jgi:IS605 OrfB family transposase